MSCEAHGAKRGPGAIWWLASYPKSGNTWMRVLLTNYLRGADQPADINDLDSHGIASGRELFDEYVGVESSDLTPEEIVRYRPVAYELISEAHAAEKGLSEPMLIKAHDAYMQTDQHVPIFSTKASAGAIYIVRNPIDIAPSFAVHTGLSLEKAVKAMGALSDGLMASEGLQRQLPQRLMSWSTHVSSWTTQTEIPVLVVRYEDLHDTPESTLGRVVHFLGGIPEAGRLARAVDFSRFDRLAAMEQATGFRERSNAATWFFRRGTVGSGHDELPEDLIRQLCSDHHELMQQFGYLPESS